MAKNAKNTVTMTITTTIEEELDAVIYGDFYLHARDQFGDKGRRDAPYVQLRQGGDWVPVGDWKRGEVRMDEKLLRKIAAHFINEGRNMRRDDD